MSDSKFTRGSEWRKWDLHIHTPASFHWNGEKFNSEPKSQENYPLIDQMINALNAAEPAVFAIMDYWTFDGWFALKNRLAQPDSPKLNKTVFPGIELRLMAPMKGRLNAHVLFSDEITDQELIDFKSNLKVEFPGQESRNLSDNALIEFARFVPDEKIRHHSLNKSQIFEDDTNALKAGSIMAELNCESYKTAIAEVPDGKAIGFMPFDTSDGLTGIERNEHYAYVLGLFKSSPIFETRNIGLWEAFTGQKTEKNASWIDDFQNALNNSPRLAISGSDAHCFVGVAGDNDRRGYGDYPSGKITWIKANPTFKGLQQAIKEPAKRSFIGSQPPKVKLYNENRSLFIDNLKVNKVSGSTLTGTWLADTNIDINPDLTAIIGNKGSGKSALADITALLGNSKQSRHFSFLKENRFRGRTGEPAKYFTAKSTWADGNLLEKNLNENPATENVELVKYIPQGHFEELCNAHVSGRSEAFENELRSVIFSHADETIRLGALNFDQLIEQQEKSLVSRIDGLKTDLRQINRKIELTEGQMLPETKKSIEELLLQKKRVLEEHDRNKPETVQQPSEELTDDQKEASEELNKIASEIEDISDLKKGIQSEIATLAVKKKSCLNLREGFALVKRSIEHFTSEHSEDAKLLDLSIEEIIDVNIHEHKILIAEQAISDRQEVLRAECSKLESQEAPLNKKKEPLNAQLNAPQKAYQNYLELVKEWEEKKGSILGDNDLPDSLKGLQHRKEQLDRLPEEREALQKDRIKTTAQIYDLLNEQRSNRESLFAPVQELIQSNELIREEYKLQFKAELSSTTELISERLFSLIKQAAGEFRGESESLLLIKELMDKHNLNKRDSLLNFVTELHNKIENSANGQAGIESMLRKGRSSSDVYNFLFDLEYLTPRYRAAAPRVRWFIF